MPASTEPVYGIEYYGDTVRRHWRIVVIAAIVGAMLAGIYLAARPPRITATSDVSISAASANPFESSTNALDPTTETQLVMSHPVAEAVTAAVDGISAQEVRRGVSVDAVSDTAIVHISFDGRTAEEARTVADALAAGYIDYRAERIAARLDAALTAIDDRATELVDQLGDIDPADDSAAVAAQRAILDRELSGLAVQRASFAQVDVSGGTLVTSAEFNATDLSPNPIITVLAGLLAGAVIGMIAAFPARAAERRWKTASDVERSTESDVLGTVTETAATIPATGATEEVLLGVRERILRRMPTHTRSIVVLDDSAESAGDLPVNLAIALARGGTPVELVVTGTDAAAKAALTAHLGVSRAHASDRVDGLTVEFPSADDLAALVRTAPELGLRVIALAAGAPESQLLAALRVSDAVVLVGTLGVSTAVTGRRVATTAREFGAQLLGTVLAPSGRVLGPPEPATPKPARRRPTKTATPGS